MKKILFIIICLAICVPGFAQDAPLTFTITSDKQVYELGEEIILYTELKNVFAKTIKTADYYKPGPISFYFKNESDKIYYNLSFIDVLRRIMSVEFAAGQSDKQGQYSLDLLKEDKDKLYTGDENYRIIGKLSLYMVDGNLTSNTITIEVKEKKLGVGFMAGIKIIEADSSLRKKLDDILSRQIAMRSNGCHQDVETLEQASECINKSVNMAYPPVVCVESGGWFFFSGGLSTGEVEDFSQGMAIEKGSQTIYRWEN